MSTSQMLVTTTESATDPRRYSLLVAGNDAELRAAQQLRYQVFARELRAVLRSPVPGLDIDQFDAHCDHLVVREDRTGQIVGTYRMLPPRGARSAGGLYCETEFAIPGLAGIRGELVETGRSCVHPEHRSGAVISLVWAGIARYLVLTGNRWLVGCASVPLRNRGLPEGAVAAAVWDIVRAGHLAPDRYRARPHTPWDERAASRPWEGGSPPRGMLPSLLRGYLRLGAWVCGPPAYDQNFDVVDFLMLLCLDRVDHRYLRHFFGGAR